MSKDKYSLIGNRYPAADGIDYGVHVVSYIPETDDYIVYSYKVSTGEKLGPEWDIDAFKITYRYKTP